MNSIEVADALSAMGHERKNLRYLAQSALPLRPFIDAASDPECRSCLRNKNPGVLMLLTLLVRSSKPQTWSERFLRFAQEELRVQTISNGYNERALCHNCEDGCDDCLYVDEC